MRRDFSEVNLDVVGIDVVHGCQLRCVGCPISVRKPKIKKISPPDFQRILGNIDVGRINTLRLYTFGEPLLHERLPELLEFIPLQKWAVSTVEISTNAQNTNYELLKEVIKLKIVNTVNVSCDGDGTPEEYERLRPPGKWGKFLNFITRLKELRDEFDPSLRLNARSICPDPSNQQRWSDLLTPLGYTTSFRDWIIMPEASKNMTGRAPTVPRGLCSFLRTPARLYSDWDGTVIPCCIHPMAGVLGNLLNSKFSELYFSDQRLDWIANLSRHRSLVPVCNGCEF